MNRATQLRAVANTATCSALIALTTLIWLGTNTPTNTHPFFYFGLIFLGGGAMSLLLAGAGATTARTRTNNDPEFLHRIRRLVLTMWLCTTTINTLGILVMLAIADGHGSTPLSTSTLTTALATAAATTTCGGITSTITRRALTETHDTTTINPAR